MNTDRRDIRALNEAARVERECAHVREQRLADQALSLALDHCLRAGYTDLVDILCGVKIQTARRLHGITDEAA